ncbi:MAG: PAS domain-containing sensor histidine kinase [Acidimicrobiia bacterium]
MDSIIFSPSGAQDAAARDMTVGSVWRRLDRMALTAGLWVSPFALAGYLIGFTVTGSPAFLLMGAVAIAIGASSALLLARRRYDAEILLLLSGFGASIAGLLVPPVVRGATTAGLVMLALVGMLVLPHGSRQRTVAFMAALTLGQLAWPAMGLATGGEAISATLIGLFAMTAGLAAVGMARRMLEESERARIEIFRRVPLGLFRCSLSGRIIDANPALGAMLGYEPAELLGRSIGELHANGGEWRGLAAALESEDGPQRFANRWVRADGTSLWVRGNAQAIRDDDGELRYFEAAVEDVTQRREVEETAYLNAARFKTLFERAPIALWEEDYGAVVRRLDELRHAGVTDLRAHLQDNPADTHDLISRIAFLDVNPAGINLIGAASKEDALVRVVPNNPPPPLLESFIDQFVAVWENRDHLALEINGLTVDGQPLDLSLHWAATRTADGRLDASRVIVAITDIGVVRRAERELAALVASKDELVASVSHELRTPITTIYGMAFELRDNASEFSAEETRDLINIIADQSRELSNIVEDLLIAARADLSTLVVRPELVDLRDEIDQIVASSPSGDIPSVDIPTGVHAWVDPLRFRQIVRNLLTNAHRYGGANVTIRAGIDHAGIYVQVIDDGPGVPAGDRERIFQPYVRATADSALPGSIGLGLPVSRRLARLMGGDLVYHHDGESIFEIRLPSVARHAVAV